MSYIIDAYCIYRIVVTLLSLLFLYSRAVPPALLCSILCFFIPSDLFCSPVILSVLFPPTLYDNLFSAPSESSRFYLYASELSSFHHYFNIQRWEKSIKFLSQPTSKSAPLVHQCQHVLLNSSYRESLYLQLIAPLQLIRLIEPPYPSKKDLNIFA